MPRQVRIEYEVAFYHVMARGNRTPFDPGPSAGSDALIAESEISFEKYDASFKSRVSQIEEAEMARNREIFAAYRPRVQKVLEQAIRDGNLKAAQSAKSELERVDEETLTVENVEEYIVPSLGPLVPILKKQLSDSKGQRTKEERSAIET